MLLMIWMHGDADDRCRFPILEIHVDNPCIGPQTGGGPIASREVEAAARGPDDQLRPDLAIGGPSWPRDRAQSTAKHSWKLRAFFSGPGDHSGAVSTAFADFGSCPLSDILTPSPFFVLSVFQ